MSESPFRAWLETRLAVEFDFACVDDPDELDRVERGVTIAGQLKKSARRYEKDDRHSIDDRSRWILGTDNDAKVEYLLEQRQEADRRRAVARSRLDAVQAARDDVTRRRSVLESVRALRWTELDREAANELVQSRQRALVALTVGNTALQSAIDSHDAARRRLAESESVARAAQLEADRADHDLRAVDTLLTQLRSRAGDDVPGEDAAALEARYRRVQRKIDRAGIGEVGRKVAATLGGESRAAQDRVRAAEGGSFAVRASSAHGGRRHPRISRRRSATARPTARCCSES